MPETDDIGQRVERLFGMYNLKKDLPWLSDDQKLELSEYSARKLYSNDFLRAREVLKAIGTPFCLSALEDYKSRNVRNATGDTDTKGKAVDKAVRPLEQRLYKLFQDYSSPEKLSSLSYKEIRELASYSVTELHGNNFSRAQEVLEGIGTPAFTYLFSALKNDELNRVYDTIISIAKKHNAEDDVAKQVAGKLDKYAVRSKGLSLITETGGSPRFLIYALGDGFGDSMAEYAEELLRELHKDERYTDIVKQELERAQDLTHTYRDLAREKAKVILETV